MHQFNLTSIFIEINVKIMLIIHSISMQMGWDFTSDTLILLLVKWFDKYWWQFIPVLSIFNIRWRALLTSITEITNTGSGMCSIPCNEVSDSLEQTGHLSIWGLSTSCTFPMTMLSWDWPLRLVTYHHHLLLAAMWLWFHQCNVEDNWQM